MTHPRYPQRFSWRCPLSCLIVLLTCHSLTADDQILTVPPGQRQLFLDDHGIATIEGLQRKLHQPRKVGAVIRSPNPKDTLQTRTAPVWDPQQKRYKFWILGSEQQFWQSPDGLNWRPGPKLNLPVRMAVYDPHDPDPARRFKAALLNRGFAVSPDGITWTQLETPAIQSSDEGNFSYDPQHGLFIHTVKRSGPYGRSVAVATSRDFTNWKDYGVVFHADDLDQTIGRRRIVERLANPTLKQTEYNTPEHYSVQIYNMGLFHYEGLYIGLPSMYHHTGKVPTDWPGFDKLNLSPYILGLVRKYGDYTGFYNIQMACSRDLKNWQRVGQREPFLSASPLGAGAYDIQTIIGPSAPVVHNDELFFYYTGIKQYAFVGSGNDPSYEDYVPDAGAICLAILRRDGFLSLDAGETPGKLTTRPCVLPGGRLRVNVAVRKHGHLQIEALNSNGDVLAVSVPITRDERRAEVAWKRGNIIDLKGQLVHLRFTLCRSGLYSYWYDTP